MSSFVGGMIRGMVARETADPKDAKIFDWDKAARLISEHKPKLAEAGLAEDWGYTNGIIFKDGERVVTDEDDDGSLYVGSLWATPTIRLDGVTHECWVHWASETQDPQVKWPPKPPKRLLPLNPPPH